MARFNSLARFRRTQGWHSGHQAIDFGTPKNTVIRAPEAGRYYRMPSYLSRVDPTAAGIWGYVEFENGERAYICHLTRHIARHRAKVVKGQALGRSGNTGYVRPSPLPRPAGTGNPEEGQHVHTYGKRKNGARFDWTLGTDKLCAGRVIAKGNLRLRANHSVASKRIAWVPFGTKVTAIGFYRQWWKIKYDGKVGWIHAKYVK